MNYKITHTTTYSFNSEVFLEPHYFRFRPKQTPYVHLIDFLIDIDTVPVGHTVILDEENNKIDFCWFNDTTDKLTITTNSIIETIPFNPFDFIIHPQNFNKLPFKYDKVQKELLSAALCVLNVSEELITYGTIILKNNNFNTIEYLIDLTKQLHNDFAVEYREDGAPLSPDKTFQLKKGSCRDLSWMQINLLRQQGIASRFASGYFYFDMESPVYELHAWVEVYIPGAGWLGLDPSHGILTGNTHFMVAASAYPTNTMPVSGGIRGSATATLITQLSIKML